MKKRWMFAAICTVASAHAFAAVNLSSEKDKVSYSIGIDLGKNFKKNDIELNMDAFKQGLADGLQGSKPQLSDQDMRDAISKLQNDIMTKRMAQMKKVAAENKAKGEAFLAENKKKPGVVTLNDGLQYKVIKEGTGNKPSKSDTVTVEYTGKLIDGKVFDSTDKTGKPATFEVSKVIPGWTEVLQLMPAGSEWEVYLPPNLAYGDRRVSPLIGPNETLIFRIKLLSIKKS